MTRTVPVSHDLAGVWVTLDGYPRMVTSVTHDAIARVWCLTTEMTARDAAQRIFGDRFYVADGGTVTLSWDVAQ